MKLGGVDLCPGPSKKDGLHALPVPTNAKSRRALSTKERLPGCNPIVLGLHSKHGFAETSSRNWMRGAAGAAQIEARWIQGG